jgi:hypothetical protein
MDMTAPEKARKAKRVAVSITTRLIRSGGEAVDVELCDLSFYGFRARAEPGCSAGDYVKLDLPHFGLVRARISWAKNGFVGGSFATAMDVRKCVAAATVDGAAQPEPFILPEPADPSACSPHH